MVKMDVHVKDGAEKRKVDVHKYVVVLASCTIGFLNWGTLQSFGTFLPFIIDRFSDKRSEASVIHSVLIAVAHFVGVASGAIVRKWGTGKLVFVGSTLVSLGFILSFFASSLVMLHVCIGLISGVGMSFTYVCAVIVIGKMFSDSSQTAVLSMQNVGTSVGGTILPYLIDWCVDRYTLRGGFLLMGGLLLNNFACAIVILCSSKKGAIEPEKSKAEVSSNHVQVSPFSVVFVMFLVGETLAMSNLIGIYIMLLDILKYRGLSSSEGIHCLVAGNVFGTVSRFLPFATKIVFKDPMIALVISCLSGLSGALILMFGNSFVVLMIASICVGMADGGIISSLAAVVFQIVVPSSQAFCYGLILTTIGVFAAGIGPLYGGIFDLTDSYTTVLLIASIIFGSCIVLVSGCIVIHRRLQPDVQDTRL